MTELIKYEKKTQDYLKIKMAQTLIEILIKQFLWYIQTNDYLKKKKKNIGKTKIKVSGVKG